MKVAVGVITDAQQKVLITRRPQHISYGGYWEFPGGKLEGDESSASALIREIEEEVGLQVLEHDFMGEVHYTHKEKKIHLLIHHVANFAGHAKPLESQLDLRWVEIAELHQYNFPPANVEIIALIDKKINKR
jgi:8-oxo-dGTP diphosphatase